MRSCQNPDNTPLYEYTLMPTHMRKMFGTDELQAIELQEPFSFTKGCRTMKIASRAWNNPAQHGTLLFDLANDPKQDAPIQDAALEERMIALLTNLMQENNAPEEQFTRLGLKVE